MGCCQHLVVLQFGVLASQQTKLLGRCANRCTAQNPLGALLWKTCHPVQVVVIGRHRNVGLIANDGVWRFP